MVIVKHKKLILTINRTINKMNGYNYDKNYCKNRSTNYPDNITITNNTNNTLNDRIKFNNSMIKEL